MARKASQLQRGEHGSLGAAGGAAEGATGACVWVGGCLKSQVSIHTPLNR